LKTNKKFRCRSQSIENNRDWIILKYTVSVYEDSIMKCTESCWIIG
jgi:hypothetical protein